MVMAMRCVRPNCEHEQLARGLCGVHYKRAHHARILPLSEKMRSPLVDATGSRRRVRDLLLRGHTSETIAERAGITPQEIRRIFAGDRLRVRAALAETLSRVHEELESTPGDSTRTARWAAREGYRSLDTYLDPDDPDSPLVNRRRAQFEAGRGEILHLIQFGWDNQGIASRLGYTENYVRGMRLELESASHD